MNRTEAMHLARRLMAEHGFGHLPVMFDRSKKRFGCAWFDKRTGAPIKMSLSEPLVVLNDESHVRDTILHEIAHLKAGIKAGHGYAWRREARALGIKGERCYDGSIVNQPPAPYNGRCGCREWKRHRAPRPGATFTCRSCRVTFSFVRGHAPAVQRTQGSSVPARATNPPATLEEWKRQKALAGAR